MAERASLHGTPRPVQCRWSKGFPARYSNEEEGLARWCCELGAHICLSSAHRSKAQPPGVIALASAAVELKLLHRGGALACGARGSKFDSCQAHHASRVKFRLARSRTSARPTRALTRSSADLKDR